MRALDLGRCNERCFRRNSAAALEPNVTTNQERIYRVKGVLGHMVAALQGIMNRPVWSLTPDWDGGEKCEGPLSLIQVATVAQAEVSSSWHLTPSRLVEI